ncbi:MAG: hypothetical protein JJU29_03215 [Verrucomicrobia bacterium]|nr:hypothetical protein [Verrucomicrobiota bacterium]MCH8510753.1 hypothetical protein [Kiritimatiellia bacterium]
MTTKALLLACLIGLCGLTALRAQTPEEIRAARRLRADAAYLEMKGDKAQALEKYEASLAILPDAAIAQKVEEMKSEALGPVADVSQLTGEIYAKLDLDGFMLFQLNVESLLNPIREEAFSLINVMQSAMEDEGELDEDSEQYMSNLKKVDPVLDWLGLYGIRGIGVSVAPVGPRISRAKTYLRIDETQADRALWRLAGTPASKSNLGYFPADTALALSTNVGPGDLWMLVRDGFMTFAPDQVEMMGIPLVELAEILPEGVDPEDLITSLKGGFFAGVMLSETTRVKIPLPDEDILDIPQPGLILGIRCENDLLHKTLLTFLRDEAEMPLTEQTVAGTTIHSFPLPIPMPFTVQPAMTLHEGTLLFASHPDVLDQALTGHARGGGLLTSPAFLEANGPMPDALNGFMYVSQKLFKEYTDLSVKILAQDLSSEGMAELNAQLAQLPSRRDDNFISSHSIRDGDGILWVTRSRTAYDHPWAPSLAREATIFATIARERAREMQRIMELRRQQMREWEEQMRQMEAENQ